MFIAIIIYFVISYRKRKIAHNREKEIIHQIHQQELLSTKIEMQTQTMQYIGREIHDSVGQKLTLASLYTQHLTYENSAPEINNKIELISNIINESLAELRHLSKSLTDDHITENNIIELLQQECKKVDDLQKSTVTFLNFGQHTLLSYQRKSILVRIVQEFLQNSMKHADCRNIHVSLRTHETVLHLQLEDDGKGFEIGSVKGKGIGINNMKRRTELIGGSFLLETGTGNGTRLNIEIPI